MGPWSKGGKISTSYPDGENIHHVEDVKCISESQRQRKKEMAPEALQVAECIQRKKEASNVDVLLMLCASITWAQVCDRWWAGWSCWMVEHCGSAAHTAWSCCPSQGQGHSSALLGWAGMHTGTASTGGHNCLSFCREEGRSCRIHIMAPRAGWFILTGKDMVSSGSADRAASLAVAWC